jgi:hypothetical protein
MACVKNVASPRGGGFAAVLLSVLFNALAEILEKLAEIEKL